MDIKTACEFLVEESKKGNIVKLIQEQVYYDIQDREISAQDTVPGETTCKSYFQIETKDGDIFTIIKR